MMTSADSQIPIRHPRPMTAAELHLELEQEQEAVVCLSFLYPGTAPIGALLWALIRSTC